MRKLAKTLAIFAPILAIGVGGAGTASHARSEVPRALALIVHDTGDLVEIELVADSHITQQVEYELELVGASRARHSGNTSVSADERHVLSRLRTSVSDSWCATVEVTEASGAQYTLKAGDC